MFLGLGMSMCRGVESGDGLKTFRVTGVVRELGAEGKTVVVSHEAVSNYMGAMTMPFRVRQPQELDGVRPGDQISFELHVTLRESWIDGVVRTATNRPVAAAARNPLPVGSDASVRPRHPLLDFKFTNELGQAVSLGDFRGQALAITFFFTRCPVPDFCPRLSKNFQEASQKLSSMAGSPTNWHFLSITFDPVFDTPSVLQVYAQGYRYDARHWSFLTGPKDKIDDLARLSGMELEKEGSLINHNFRTLIIDASGHLQTTFPFGGDLTDAIVAEMLKAAVGTNKPATGAHHDTDSGISGTVVGPTCWSACAAARPYPSLALLFWRCGSFHLRARAEANPLEPT